MQQTYSLLDGLAIGALQLAQLLDHQQIAICLLPFHWLTHRFVMKQELGHLQMQQLSRADAGS